MKEYNAQICDERPTDIEFICNRMPSNGWVLHTAIPIKSDNYNKIILIFERDKPTEFNNDTDSVIKDELEMLSNFMDLRINIDNYLKNFRPYLKQKEKK